MQREISRSSQLGLTSGIRRDVSELISAPKQERFGRSGGRRGKLWILCDPATASGGASAAARLVMETIEDEYYQSAAPSITTALEEAVQAANHLLHDYNVGAPAHKQAYLGVTCLALHGKDAYVAQVQPARAIVVHQGTPRSFPDGPPRPEADLTPLGLDPEVQVELYRSPFTAGDTITLLTSGLAQVIARAEDEYGLAYHDHAGAVSYLAHLAARENLMDEHAVVVEEPARKPVGGSLDSLGREWVRETAGKVSGNVRRLAARVAHRDGSAGGASGAWIVRKKDEALSYSKTALAGRGPSAPRGKPSRLQLVSTILGVLLLFGLAGGLGTRAYQGYKQNEELGSLIGAAQKERRLAGGKPATIAIKHLDKAQAHLLDARRLDPADARIGAELARISADRETVYKVEDLSDATLVAPRKGGGPVKGDKLVVVDGKALVLDRKRGTVRAYDLKTGRMTKLSPGKVVRFTGLSWREGGIVTLDEKGRLWDYDTKAKAWTSLKLGGKVNWKKVTAFDSYGPRAYVAAKGVKGVLAYDAGSSGRPKLLRARGKEEAIVPSSISADGNVWLINERDDSILKASNDKISRRLWVDAQPRIAEAANLVALDTNKFLYMLDEKRDRVLQIAPTGQLQAQFRLPGEFESGDRIDAMYADEAEETLYLIIDGKLYASPLPRPEPAG